jgi:hypothetical protein
MGIRDGEDANRAVVGEVSTLWWRLLVVIAVLGANGCAPVHGTRPSGTQAVPTAMLDARPTAAEPRRDLPGDPVRACEPLELLITRITGAVGAAPGCAGIEVRASSPDGLDVVARDARLDLCLADAEVTAAIASFERCRSR